MCRNLLGGKSKDFVTAVDEKNIIVVKELTEKDGSKELEQDGKRNASSMLKADASDDNIHIAYGTVVSDIKEVFQVLQRGKALALGRREDLL